MLTLVSLIYRIERGNSNKLQKKVITVLVPHVEENVLFTLKGTMNVNLPVLHENKQFIHQLLCRKNIIK